MQAKITSEKYVYNKCTYEGKLHSDDSLEMIVPDALPDIAEIIDTKINCYLKGKDSDTGTVTVSAAAAGCILFRCDAGRVHKVEFNLPVTFMGADDEIHQDCKIVASVHAKTASTEVLNPRKVMLRVSSMCEVTCFENAELTVPSNIEDDAIKTQILRKKYDISAVSDVREKLFVVSDEIKLTSGRPSIDEIVSNNMTIITDDIKSVGSKVILNGYIQGDIVYSSPDTQSLNTIRTESHFSQIIDFDTNCEANNFIVKSNITGVYMNSDLIAASSERTINLEVHVVSQCISVGKLTLNVLSDAYSTSYKLEAVQQKVILNSISSSEVVSDTAKVSVKTENAADIICADALISVVSSENEDGNLTIRASGEVHVIYSDDSGNVNAGREYVELKCETGAAFGSVSYVCACPEVLVQTSLGQNSADCKLKTNYTLYFASNMETDCISSISYDEEEKINLDEMPSFVIKRPGKNDDLWSIAKRYCSSCELIVEQNNAESEEDVLKMPVIIVPKFI